MGKWKSEDQPVLWVPTMDLPTSPGHPFYEQLNTVLLEHGFDAFVEGLCREFYAPVMGRPSIVPGVYFRMLLVGYFEGIDSERGIAWRVADSMALRSFLGYPLTETTPDHSSVSRTRRLFDLETHQEVFTWILAVLAKEGLLRGKTLGVDATTLEANAALRSIVRRDTGESYTDFLTRLAKASGIETPTRADLAKLDRKRPRKGSNDDWEHPYDPDAEITKMKDGRTHLAHKAEHASDMETQAVVAVTLSGGAEGDTDTLPWTLEEAESNLRAVGEDPEAAKHLSEAPAAELVADKGYHSNETCAHLRADGIRSYLSEPDRGRRNWKGKAKERAAVYANRRRIRGARGKRLLRMRGELLERSFAHAYSRSRMRRVHLRGRSNILKRLLVHVGGFNLSLVMRRLMGCGTARGLQSGLFGLLDRLHAAAHGLQTLGAAAQSVLTHFRRPVELNGPVWPGYYAA
jgi:transposase